MGVQLECTLRPNHFLSYTFNMMPFENSGVRAQHYTLHPDPVHYCKQSSLYLIVIQMPRPLNDYYKEIVKKKSATILS